MPIKYSVSGYCFSKFLFYQSAKWSFRLNIPPPIQSNTGLSSPTKFHIVVYKKSLVNNTSLFWSFPFKQHRKDSRRHISNGIQSLWRPDRQTRLRRHFCEAPSPKYPSLTSDELVSVETMSLLVRVKFSVRQYLTWNLISHSK